MSALFDDIVATRDDALRRAGTKPTAGTPYHPEVRRVVFETSAPLDAGPAEQYAATLLARTVGHLGKVDVGALVSAYLEALEVDLNEADLPGDIVGAEILRITCLVESVLDQARSAVRTHMAIDLTTTLIPRLKGTRS